jgi:hypothetical protein
MAFIDAVLVNFAPAVNHDLRNNMATHEQIHLQLSKANPELVKERKYLMDIRMGMLEASLSKRRNSDAAPGKRYRIHLSVSHIPRNWNRIADARIPFHFMLKSSYDLVVIFQFMVSSTSPRPPAALLPMQITNLQLNLNNLTILDTSSSSTEITHTHPNFLSRIERDQTGNS